VREKYLRRVLLTLPLASVGALGAASCSDRPIRDRQNEVKTINCYGSSPGNTVSVTIEVEFQDHGRMAILRFGQDTFRLPFQTSWLIDDVYGNGTVELRIDPEVYLTGLRDTQIGPCDLE
jgi:hypothetical protein